mgnify:CR=1 FL=1
MRHKPPCTQRMSTAYNNSFIIKYCEEKYMELTIEAKHCVLVFGYVWLEMISLCVMSFLNM